MNITDRTYNQLKTDFRSEAVAANILRFYDHQAQIVLQKIGLNDRARVKDIKTIKKTFEHDGEETLIIETFREGIYDYLPEGIFHPPSLGVPGTNVDSAVREIQRQRRVEDEARRFFQPFEQEFFYTHISALLKEAEFDADSDTDALLEFASELWPILKKLEPASAKVLVNILPFIHEVRGNKNWLERFLSAFLEVPVEIVFVPNQLGAGDDEESITALGEARLGITLIPTGPHTDGNRNWQIRIGTIPYEELARYVPGSSFRELLAELYEFFVPLSAAVEEHFITQKQQDSFVISTKAETSRLGYATFI